MTRHAPCSRRLAIAIRRIAIRNLAFLALGGCADATSSVFPEDQVEPLIAPLAYREWWSQVEQCSGRRGDLADISWYRTNRGNLLQIDGAFVGGYWWSQGNRIVVTRPTDARMVRHEMLHALLKNGTHPDVYFAKRCGAFVQFTATERLPAHAASARRTTADSVLSVDFTVLPTHGSFSRTAGHLTILIRARNRSGVAAWVQLPSFVLASARAGENGYGAVSSSVLEQFFDAEQERLVAVDLKVSAPGTYRVSARYGAAESSPMDWVVSP